MTEAGSSCLLLLLYRALVWADFVARSSQASCNLQEYPAWKNYACLCLYILAYMLNDSIMDGLVILTLGKRKLQETEGRWLKLLSGLVIFALGIVSLFNPEWLT